MSPEDALTEGTGRALPLGPTHMDERQLVQVRQLQQQGGHVYYQC